MIYTSYYAKRHYGKENNYCIGVSLTAPPNSVDVLFTWLGPTPSSFRTYKRMLRDGLKEDAESFMITCYKAKIAFYRPSSDIDNFVNKIKELDSKGYNVFLLCYEKPGTLCHRHMLAEYLNQHYGLQIKEYKGD